MNTGRKKRKKSTNYSRKSNTLPVLGLRILDLYPMPRNVSFCKILGRLLELSVYKTRSTTCFLASWSATTVTKLCTQTSTRPMLSSCSRTSRVSSTSSLGTPSVKTHSKKKQRIPETKNSKSDSVSSRSKIYTSRLRNTEVEAAAGMKAAMSVIVRVITRS